MDEKKKDDNAMDIDEDELLGQHPRDPLLKLFDMKFLLQQADDVVPKAEKKQITEDLLSAIKEREMAPWYETLCSSFGWKLDKALLKKMKTANEAEAKSLEAKIQDAEKNLGDAEVQKAITDRAEFYSRIGDKDTAVKYHEEALAKAVGSGSRIDQVFTIIRLAIFHSDTDLIKANIEKAKGFVESGGDWERRNLLKIYEGVYKILTRDFAGAAHLFLDSIATFTCYELCDYNTFIFYAVISTMVSLDRATLKKKVVNSPEVLSVYRDIPNLQELLQSLYRCQYDKFFHALSLIIDQVKRDPYFSVHHNYWFRQMRIVGYKQFLQSYKSVTLKSMAASFGVSVDFLDKELSKFIASGHLTAKIDKVKGIVETNRPDARNAQYQATLKQGDVLLNRIQKLTKIISY